MALKDAAENLNTWKYTILTEKKDSVFLFQLNLSTIVGGGGGLLVEVWLKVFCQKIKGTVN